MVLMVTITNQEIVAMRGSLPRKMATIVLLLPLAFPFVPARADDQAPVSEQEKQDIKQLMSLTETDQMIDLLSGIMSKSLFDTPTPIVSQNDMDTLKLQARKVIVSEFSKSGGLFDQAAAFYAQHFTDDEIKRLISFYQSDLGKKLLATGPDTVKFMGTIMQSSLPSLFQAYKAQIALCTPAKDGQPLTCPG